MPRVVLLWGKKTETTAAAILKHKEGMEKAPKEEKEQHEKRMGNMQQSFQRNIQAEQ